MYISILTRDIYITTCHTNMRGGGGSFVSEADDSIAC